MPKLRVLCADDHQQMRRAIVSLLETHFEIVGAAANGKELIEAAILLQPDVIVSDTSMPILTGLEAMRALRSGWHEVPFVLVSICALDAVDWIGQGASAVVDKLDLLHDLAPAVRAAGMQEIYFSRSVCAGVFPGISSPNSIHCRAGVTDAPFHVTREPTLRIQAGPDVRITYGVD